MADKKYGQGSDRQNIKFQENIGVKNSSIVGHRNVVQGLHVFEDTEVKNAFFMLHS